MHAPRACFPKIAMHVRTSSWCSLSWRLDPPPQSAYARGRRNPNRSLLRSCDEVSASDRPHHNRTLFDPARAFANQEARVPENLVIEELDWAVIPRKAQMISDAVERYGIKSVIDVGACWGVNGGYTFHA